MTKAMNATLAAMHARRDAHHAKARLLARGLSVATVARETGSDVATLRTMLADPTFRDLVAAYTERETEGREGATCLAIIPNLRAMTRHAMRHGMVERSRPAPSWREIDANAIVGRTQRKSMFPATSLPFAA